MNTFTFERATESPLNGCKIQLFKLTPKRRTLVDEITEASINSTSFNLLPKKDYEIVTSKDLYDEDKTVITTKGISESKEITQNLYLKTSKIELDLFTFDDATKDELTDDMVQFTEIF